MGWGWGQLKSRFFLPSPLEWNEEYIRAAAAAATEVTAGTLLLSFTGSTRRPPLTLGGQKKWSISYETFMVE